MIMSFVFVLYMATHIVPGHIDQFQISAENPTNNEQKNILTLKRQKKAGWQITVSNTGKKKEEIFFQFAPNRSLYIHNSLKGKSDTVEVLSVLTIEKDHKKWRKATKIAFKSQENSRFKKEMPNLYFEINKKGRRKYIIQVDKGKMSGNNQIMPPLQITWK